MNKSKEVLSVNEDALQATILELKDSNFNAEEIASIIREYVASGKKPTLLSLNGVLDAYQKNLV